MMDMNGMMNGMMAFGWLGLLLGVALLVLVVVGIVRLVSGRNGGTPDDALSTAEKLYARGDISRAEFNAIKRTLG